MDFLPAGYEVPTTSNYMKFQLGENKFRILSSPILGYEWWVETEGTRKPVRVDLKTQIDISKIENPDEVKHFWAMPVWNYQAKRVQILEITQKGIQKTLRALARDEDWGSPVQTYDIVVTKTGEGFETKYEVLPKPAKPLDPEIITQFESMNITLEALYSGDDPFAFQSK